MAFNLTPAEAQKWVALELVGSLGILVLSTAREGNFPGASQFVPPLIVFGGAAVFAGFAPTATTAAVIGLTILLVQMSRPVGQGLGFATAAGDIASGIGNLAGNIGSNPPTTSQGHK